MRPKTGSMGFAIMALKTSFGLLAIGFLGGVLIGVLLEGYFSAIFLFMGIIATYMAFSETVPRWYRNRWNPQENR
jgi:hypothetical protein